MKGAAFTGFFALSGRILSAFTLAGAPRSMYNLERRLFFHGSGKPKDKASKRRDRTTGIGDDGWTGSR
jgi:hypothetical protein